MSKVIELNQLKDKDKKLEQMGEHLEQLKKELAEMIDEYEREGADGKKVDTLTEALDAMADACEMIFEAMEE